MSRPCECRFLEGLTSCVTIMLKLLFGLGMLIFLFVTLIGALALFVADQDKNFAHDQLPNSIQWKVKAANLWALIASLIGAYGAVCCHAPSLRTFSMFAILNVVFLVVCGYFEIKTLDKTNQNYMEQFKIWQKSYDWTNSNVTDSDLVAYEATIKWNNLQSALHCCGIEKAKEWDQFRPTNLSNTDYPSSCYEVKKVHFNIGGRIIRQLKKFEGLLFDNHKGHTTTTGLLEDGSSIIKNTEPEEVNYGIYTDGCEKKLEFAEKIIIVGVFFYTMYLFVLACLSICIIIIDGSDQNQNQDETRQRLSNKQQPYIEVNYGTANDDVQYNYPSLNNM